MSEQEIYEQFDVMIEPELELRLIHVRLDALIELTWSDNPKLHSQKTIVESIRAYGFQAPPKLSELINEGESGILYGNGRTAALVALQQEGAERPANIAAHADDGEWCVPVYVGNDLASQQLAAAMAIDHNMLNLSAADAALADSMRLFDDDLMTRVLDDMRGDVPELVTISAEDMRVIVGDVERPDQTQGRWDVPDPKEHDPVPNFEDKPLPDTTLSLDGRVSFKVPRQAYLDWMDDVRVNVSFVPAEIEAEIRQRLGLPDEEMNDAA